MKKKKAKKKQTRITAPRPWFADWENKKIGFQRVFEGGGTHLVDTAGNPGEFKLKPNFSGGSLRDFTIVVPDGTIDTALNGKRLRPKGSQKPLVIGRRLPIWTGPAEEDTYFNGLMQLVDELHEENTRLQRLECEVTFPVGAGGVATDRLRVVLLKGAVEGATPGRPTDLAVIVFTLLRSTGLAPAQNGGGSGPPLSDSGDFT